MGISRFDTLFDQNASILQFCLLPIRDRSFFLSSFCVNRSIVAKKKKIRMQVTSWKKSMVSNNRVKMKKKRKWLLSGGRSAHLKTHLSSIRGGQFRKLERKGSPRKRKDETIGQKKKEKGKIPKGNTRVNRLPVC